MVWWCVVVSPNSSCFCFVLFFCFPFQQLTNIKDSKVTLIPVCRTGERIHCPFQPWLELSTSVLVDIMLTYAVCARAFKFVLVSRFSQVERRRMTESRIVDVPRPCLLTELPQRREYERTPNPSTRTGSSGDEAAAGSAAVAAAW